MKDKVLISQHLCQTLRERSLICQRSMTSLSLTSRRCVYFSDLRQKGDEECFPCCALFPVHISLPQKYDFFCKFFWLLRMMWCCHSPNIHKKVGCRLCLDTDFWKKKPSWMICNIHLHGDKNAKSCSWWETFCQIILAQRSQWIQAYSGTFFCSLCWAWWMTGWWTGAKLVHL